MIQYKENNAVTAEQIHDLFSSEGWRSGNNPDRLLNALKNSETLITAWDKNRLAGLVNAFSDSTMVVYIHYFIIHKEYQSRGIGRQMMNEVLKKYQEYKHLVLISNNDKIGFFEKCGFRVCEGATAMEIRKVN
ncbi:MAG TPA: GNAT family N-acetyltransferase [Chitinispirillaceae bacterium]|nr:GNAT family N-acetyltransferase [Chitinispirillaceae bacterium]